jgi:hypothetical protein
VLLSLHERSRMGDLAQEALMQIFRILDSFMVR